VARPRLKLERDQRRDIPAENTGLILDLGETWQCSYVT